MQTHAIRFVPCGQKQRLLFFKIFLSIGLRHPAVQVIVASTARTEQKGNFRCGSAFC